MFKKPKTIQEVLMPILNIPETMQINEVLNLLTKKTEKWPSLLQWIRRYFWRLPLEDIVEELFGEIEDERQKALWKKKDSGYFEYLFS